MKRFWRNQRGVTSVEYALVATLIAVVIVTAVRYTGAQTAALYGTVASGLTSAR